MKAFHETIQRSAAFLCAVLLLSHGAVSSARADQTGGAAESTGRNLAEAVFWSGGAQAGRLAQCGVITIDVQAAPVAEAEAIVEAVEEVVEDRLPFAQATASGVFSDGTIILSRSLNGVMQAQLLTRGGDRVTTINAEDLTALTPDLSNAVEGLSLRKQLVDCLHNEDAEFGVQVWVGGGRTLGSEIDIRVRSDRDGYLLLVGLDKSGGISVLYPNKSTEPRRLTAGVDLRLPGDADYALSLLPPAGQEVVKAFVSESPLSVVDLDELGAGEIFARLDADGEAASSPARDFLARLDAALGGPETWSDSRVEFFSKER